MLTPALAQPLSRVVENLSRHTLESIPVVPDGADVSVGIDTVPMAPGQSGRIDLPLGQCQPRASAGQAQGHPAEFRPAVDLCVDPKLTVGAWGAERNQFSYGPSSMDGVASPRRHAAFVSATSQGVIPDLTTATLQSQRAAFEALCSSE